MKSIRANPGGQLDPTEIFGRDLQIEQLWTILDGRCVYMNDLRRIGKTQIMVKMAAQPRAGWVCVKRDLGRFHTAEEFARQAFEDSASVLTGGKTAMRRVESLLGWAAGTEVAGILKLADGSVAPWKEVLERTFQDIADSVAARKQRLLFLWDEVPFLIDNIAKRQGQQVAMEVLDVIRSLTQDFDSIRTLLTGSIGLHHVLRSLKAAGYAGSPLNRMELFRPGPLESSDAVLLAGKLLQGEAVRVDDPAKCAAAIAALTGNVAFYVHKLISRLPPGTTQTTHSIAAVLDSQLSDLNNDWDLEHYHNRLAEYYGSDAPLAVAILDSVAVSRSMGLDEIRSAVSNKMPVEDEKLRSVLKLLCKDHYLDHSSGGKYSFYLAVVARWWRIARDLREVG